MPKPKKDNTENKAAESQNKLEMKNTNMAENIRNKLKLGLSNLLESEQKRKKVNLEKPEVRQDLSGVTRNNIIKYLKFLYDKKYWWQGNPPGYKKIEQLAGFKDKNISNKIRATLETLEIIGTEEKTIGKRKLNVTKLKMELQEALKNIFR